MQEREDEFDNVEVTHDKKVEDDKKLIDIVTRERSEVAHVPDADDDDEEFLAVDANAEGGAGEDRGQQPAEEDHQCHLTQPEQRRQEEEAA